MSKKVWLSMHPRNLVLTKITAYVRASTPLWSPGMYYLVFGNLLGNKHPCHGQLMAVKKGIC